MFNLNRITRRGFYIRNTFFQLRISAVYFFNELSLKCCLCVLNLHKHHLTETLLDLDLVYLCLCLLLGLFISYLCDSFSIIIFIFIMINNIISSKHKQLLFWTVYFLLVKNFFQVKSFCQVFALRCCFSFCLIYCQFQPAVAYESVTYKKSV